MNGVNDVKKVDTYKETIVYIPRNFLGYPGEDPDNIPAEIGLSAISLIFLFFAFMTAAFWGPFVLARMFLKYVCHEIDLWRMSQ